MRPRATRRGRQSAGATSPCRRPHRLCRGRLGRRRRRRARRRRARARARPRARTGDRSSGAPSRPRASRRPRSARPPVRTVSARIPGAAGQERGPSGTRTRRRGCARRSARRRRGCARTRLRPSGARRGASACCKTGSRSGLCVSARAPAEWPGRGAADRNRRAVVARARLRVRARARLGRRENAVGVRRPAPPP
jgi:hypothetical protein